MSDRIDNLDPLPYMAEMPSLMSYWGRVDIHTIIGHFLWDNKIHGSYLEFGVGMGRSAVSAVRAYRRVNIANEFVLFDSFQGLPRLNEVDASSEQFKEGSFAFSQDEVAKFLQDHGVIIDDTIQFCPGWFDKSFKNWAEANRGKKAAVVHIDCDLYSSCKEILDNLRPFLQTGTAILFDDWNCFKASSQFGERRAAEEWLSANSDLRLNLFCPYAWSGQAFILEMRED